MDKLHLDTVVIGGGVTGLSLAKKLASLGISVALIEKCPRLATGPSTRNEGWLHAGTYHANSIGCREEAIEVARRCIYGYEQIKSYVPEAVEDINSPSYVIVRDDSHLDETLLRWDQAGVKYRSIPLSHLQKAIPEIELRATKAAFEVVDLAINTRIFYKKLLSDCQRMGVLFFYDTTIKFGDDSTARLTISDCDHAEIEAQVFVHTSGFGVGDLFRTEFAIEVPLRYWKSHLLITPRLTKHGVFCLDPLEAAIMHHSQYSIVGLNEDAILCEKPDYDVVGDNIELIRQGLKRLFGTLDFDKAPILPIACIKTDVVKSTSTVRSLNISVFEPKPNHICALPGKMTESAYLTDVLTNIVFERLQQDEIAQRPLDTWVLPYA